MTLHDIETVPLMNEAVWHICRRCGKGGYTLPQNEAEASCKAAS